MISLRLGALDKEQERVLRSSGGTGRQMRSRVWASCAMALILLLTAVLSGCGSDGSNASGGSTSSSSGADAAAPAGSPFSVVMVAATSGPFKVYGKIQEAAVKGAADYLNDQGGILDHPVEVHVLNDNSEPETAAAEFVKYMSAGNPEPNLVFPGTAAPDSAALLPLIKRYGVLAIGAVLGSGCSEGAAEICPSAFLPESFDPEAMPTVARWMTEKNVNNVGVLLEEGPQGEEQLAFLEPALKAAGLKYETVTFPPTAVDLKPQISQLQSAGAEAIYGDSLGPGVGYIGIGRQQLGLTAKIPLLFGPLGGSSDLTKLMPARATENAFVTAYAVNVPSEHFPARNLMIKYSKPYGDVTEQPLSLGGIAWTDLILAKNAAEQAESIESDPMVNALEGLEGKATEDPMYLSLRGKLTYTKENHENAAAAENTSSFVVVPVGPLKGGMIQSK